MAIEDSSGCNTYGGCQVASGEKPRYIRILCASLMVKKHIQLNLLELIVVVHIIEDGCMGVLQWTSSHYCFSPSGSSHAEVMEESIKKFGDVPVHEAAQHCPVEAWRVWNSSYPRHYTENSEVCKPCP